MRTHDDYFLRSKRTSSRLRRAVVVSLIVHGALLGVASAVGYFWKSSAPQELGFQMEFLAKGLPDAPEGLETTRVEGLPPGPPEQKPAPAVAEKKEEPKEPEPPKPEPPKPEPPKPEPPKPEPPKPEVKKPDPKKEEPKKKEEKPEPPKKEAKAEEPKKEKKEEKKPKLDSLGDDVLAKVMDDDFPSMSDKPSDKPGGGLEGARVSDRVQTGYGDINSTETGISVKGVPSILGTWANQVRRKVQRFWNEPPGVGISNRVVVSFWVGRGGELIGEPEIVEASNDATLDESGLQAIRNAAPFPALPPNYDQARQQVLFVFTIAG